MIHTQHTELYQTLEQAALNAARKTFELMAPGWTEQQAANMLGTLLRQENISTFFHEPFVWFGDRTKFAGMRRNRIGDVKPSERRYQEQDVVILDVAPLRSGLAADIGYTACKRPFAEYKRAMTCLNELYRHIPAWIHKHHNTPKNLIHAVNETITRAGFKPIYDFYPFHVLGHKLTPVPLASVNMPTPLKFGVQAFLQVFNNGIRHTLVNHSLKSFSPGFWAIEPHLAGSSFGAKFEFILYIDESYHSHWINHENTIG